MSLIFLFFIYLFFSAKRVLIIYAHQSSSSFNAAAKNAAVEVLTAQGCTVEVSDLYAMNFKATATAEDIKGRRYVTFLVVIIVNFFCNFIFFYFPRRSG